MARLTRSRENPDFNPFQIYLLDVNPTIFDHVDPAAEVAQEEIFGPVVSLIDFSDEEEAVRIANQTSYGLATALWTSDLDRAHRMAARLDSGFVWINCCNYWTPSIPYGAVATAALGRTWAWKLWRAIRN